MDKLCLRYNQIIDNSFSTLPCGKRVGTTYTKKAMSLHKKICKICFDAKVSEEKFFVLDGDQMPSKKHLSHGTLVTVPHQSELQNVRLHQVKF